MGIFSKWEKVATYNDEYDIVKVKKSGKMTLLNKKDKTLDKHLGEFDSIEAVVTLSDGSVRVAAFKTSEGYMFANKSVEFKTNYCYKKFFAPNEKHILVQTQNDKFDLLDFDGNKIGNTLDYADEETHEGMRNVIVNDGRTQGQTYFMENKGYPMPHRFAKVYNFVNGMGRCVRKDGTFTYANTNGSVLNIYAIDANDFDIDGHATVKNEDKKLRLVNKRGNYMDGAFDELSSAEKDGLNFVRTGYIKHNKNKYQVKIINGEVAFSEWLNLVKRNPELFQYLPDNLFRNPKDVGEFEGIVNKECEKLTNNARKLMKNPKATEEDLDLIDKYLNKVDWLDKIVREKKASAKANNTAVDKKIKDEQLLKKMEEEERKRNKAKKDEERLQKQAELEEKKKAEKQLFEAKKERERQKISKQKAALSKRLEK